jgi:hypothetical protein
MDKDESAYDRIELRTVYKAFERPRRKACPRLAVGIEPHPRNRERLGGRIDSLYGSLLGNKVCSNQGNIANAATNIKNVHPLFQAGAHQKITRETGE